MAQHRVLFERIISDRRELQAGPRNNQLAYLTVIKLVNCNVQSRAIPSHILTYLNCLKELEVRCCSEVEVIFEPWIVRRTAPFNLQKLTLKELSMLTQVWENNHHGILCFQNLQHVSVKKCHNLKSLFPAALAKNLKKLESLTIEDCNQLLQIVEKVEDAAADVTEKFVFPRLTLLELSGLQQLTCFYSETFILECPELKNLSVFKCGKLEVFQSDVEASSSTSIKKQPFFFDLKVIPNLEKLSLDPLNWKDTSGRLWSKVMSRPKLQEMSIHNYQSPKIFHIQDANIAEHRMLGHLTILKLIKASNLQFIVSEDIPWLNTLCEKLHELDVSWCHSLTTLIHSTSAISFSSLKQLIISNCNSLEYLFTSSAARKLMHLEMISATYCYSMEKIVAKEQQDEMTSEGIKFERLSCIELGSLRRLECFYSGNDTLQLPSLKQMIMWSCPKMKYFSQGSTLAKSFGGIQDSHDPNADLVFHNDLKSSVKRVLLRWGFLQAMDMDCLSDHLGLQEARDHKVSLQNEWLGDLVTLNLYMCFLPYAIPSYILPYLKNLKELKVRYCNKAKVIFEMNDTDPMETPSQLEKLHLEGLSELTHIWEKNSQGVLIFQNLQQVFVSHCEILQTLFPISLATSTSTVSFFCLREMHITSCRGLQYLFTSSAAKMLTNIEAITVEKCESIKKIVAKDDETTSEGIIFEQLHSIYLITLSSLECFYSGDDTLQLSSLIQVKILHCPKMEIFSQGLIHAKSFRGIQTSSNVKDDLVFHKDLNTSIKVMFLQRDRLAIWDSPMLKEIWLRSETVPDWCFRNLNSLVVESCEFLSNAILPSHLLPLLRNLKMLQVKKCNSVKSIFGHSKMGSQGSQSLPFLEKLRVQDCEALVEIVAKEEAAAEEANQGLIIFLSLISLKLSNLPNLRSIYFGMRMLEWPMLKKFEVSQCQKLNFFTTEFQNSPDSHLQGQDSFQTEQQDIVSLEKVTPHLEILSLGKKEALMIKQGKLCVDLPALNSLILRDFHDESDEFPFAFCSKATFTSCFKQLVVSDSAFKEIFPSQTFNTEYAKIFSQLKQLYIVKLSQLESIGLEHSWVHPFLQKLEGLLVRHCDCLTNLTPSTVSFSNLKELSVYNCHGLKYLFTSSTAKSLAGLNHIRVTNCNSIKEIVAEDEDEYEDEITFGWLSSLTLDSLPELTSFYSGSSTLNLPYPYVTVSLSQCSNMEVFSHGNVVPKNLEMTINGFNYIGDINSTIAKRQPEKSFSGERSFLDSTH